MVMIIFKPQTEIKPDIILSDVENYELYGRELFAKYAYVQEQLVFDVGKLSILNICELALGMLLADYCFDKYISNMPNKIFILSVYFQFFFDSHGIILRSNLK